MKTIKDAVIELGGKWPNGALNYIYSYLSASCFSSAINVHIIPEGKIVFSKEQFESTAKRLGYINGYLFGKEYATDGVKPDLMDDVLIDAFYCNEWSNDVRFDSLDWNFNRDDHYPVTAFRIIDHRYKPVSEISESKSDVSDWWDYDRLQVKSGKTIPTGSEVLFFDRAPNPFKCKVMYSSDYVIVIRCIDGSVNKDMIGVDISRCPFEENFNQIKPLDWNIKAEIRREKVIEAAIKVASGGLTKDMYSALYNAGMLVLPQKSGDTE